ncbi:RNA-directed DNA polymerase, eukaryota [Tanacetum coccineum]
MIFKVDFAKAYDSVRWDYLDDVLISFGFGPKWRSWIRGSLSSGKASILVNGSLTTEFHLYRGLKQGDPLAPFLFLLIMESLHLSFSRAVEAGIFKGYKIDPSTTLSHLFYADDAVFIGEWSHSNLKGIMNILRCFSLLSEVIEDLLGSMVYRCFASKKFEGYGAFLVSIRSNRALLFQVGRDAYLSHDNSYGPNYISLNRLEWSCSFASAFIRHGGSILKEVISLTVKVLISFLIVRFVWGRLQNKDISVADKINTSISSSFRRHVRGGVESQQLDQLSLLLDTVILSNMDDRWFWDLNGDGVFQVKDVRSMLDEVFLPKMEVPTRWIKRIPNPIQSIL